MPPRPLPRLAERVHAYLAPPGLEAEVARELRGAELLHQHGRLLITAAGELMDTSWAQDVWLDGRVCSIRSIGDANKQLRAVQRSWVPYADGHHRRVALITEALPPVRQRRWSFPVTPPTADLGAFTLLDRDTLLYSATRRSPFPHGEILFEEDREGPPSRAYRKLWEAFTVAGEHPAPGSRCLDLGASPGGWTWVLAELGAQVVSVDRAPLAPEIARRANVTARVGSAFALDPAAETATAGPYDWLFSDVICYPARLLRLVQRWLEAGAAKRVVCTLKFQGETDHETVEGFRRIPGGRLVHLSHNRHELTFFRLAPGEGAWFDTPTPHSGTSRS